MTLAAADRRNSFSGDVADRVLAETLFAALKEATGDGVGITREAYGAKESEALDIVEAQARELGLATEPSPASPARCASPSRCAARAARRWRPSTTSSSSNAG